MINIELFKILACPICGSKFKEGRSKLACIKGHSFDVFGKVPIMAKLTPYLETEAKAWEKDWKKDVSKDALKAYQKNMRVFKKLGYWEESGEAAKFIPSRSDFTVLDLGCGNGVSTANIKGKLVVGLDLSRKELALAKERFPDKEYVIGDAVKLPFANNTFDLIVAINLLHHIDKPEDVLKECYRVLKKGGALFTVDPNLYNPIGYVGRGLFRLLRLKRFFPTFPQFALGAEEYQFMKKTYYTLFKKSPFKKFKIRPHRIERILFFATILIPVLARIPFYERVLESVSKIGNSLVQHRPFDNLCYFWIAEAEK